MRKRSKPAGSGPTTTPALTEYEALEQAYDWFNAELFQGQLPRVLFTLQRKGKAMGYFSAKRFKSRLAAEEEIDELAINPAMFEKPDIEILDNLVHEMCHVWQEHFGQPSRSGYHNKEWAAKMKEVGLQPSHTGRLGGMETGQKVSDYRIAGGPFERSAETLLATGFTFHWVSLENKPAKGPASKVKFTCHRCGQNVWGKPGASVLCGVCSEPGSLVPMAAQGGDRESKEDYQILE